MFNFLDLIFLGNSNEVNRVEKEYGTTIVSKIDSSNFIIMPLSSDNYAILNNYACPNGYTVSNFKEKFVGKTNVWLTEKFKDISDPDSFHIFSDKDISLLEGCLLEVDPSDYNNHIRFRAVNYLDIEILHECLCKILGIGIGSVMFGPNYDPTKDGCACRVCGTWSPMAPSDGLPDGKMNCWTCSTYRPFLCMKAEESIKP